MSFLKHLVEVSLELEMISFLPLIFKFFFRGAGFTRYLRMFSRVFVSFWKIWEQGPMGFRRSSLLSGNPFLPMPPLSQFILAVFS